MTDIYKDPSLISLILPIYNEEKYLRECLDSIMSQLYQNIEVILVNDGSTDKSAGICQEYVEKDRRFSLHSKENGGVSSARNMGLSLVRGDWVMFIDPDDAVGPDMIGSLLEAVCDEIDIVCCCCQVVLDQERVEDHFYKGDRLFSSFEDKQDLWGQLLDYKHQHPNFDYAAIAVPWAKLYRTSMLKDNNVLFDRTLVRMQDNVFNTYAFFYARKVLYIDKPLYIYRYAHISHYMTEYAERLQMIYTNLQMAREKSFEELGLFKSEFLSRKYYEEAIYSMVCTCKYGIFIKKHSKEDQENMFYQLVSQPCFEHVLTNYKDHTNMAGYFFRHSMVCLYYQLIVHKQLGLLYMIGRLRALLGR